MEKYIKYIVSVLLLFTFASCEERLEEEVFSFLKPDNFYKTADDGYAGLLSVTEVYSTSASFRRDFLYLEVRGDNHHHGRDRSGSRAALDLFTTTPTNSLVTNIYSSFYTSNYRANALIENLGNASYEENDDIRIAQIAEARFYRGLNYFFLVRLFGKVPLITNLAQLDLLDQIPRSPVAEVYNQIIEDFTFAKNNLPNRSQQVEGRPSAAAAATYLAKVYLTLENWSQAESEARAVMDAQEYDLYTTFEEAFLHENQNKGENMFSIQHGDIFPYNNLMDTWWSPANLPGNGKHPMTTDLRDAFEENDQRFDFTFKQEFGNGSVDPFNIGIGQLIIGKWRHSINRTLNYTLLRYPETLLIFAEASNEASGPTPEGYDAVNKVRERAGLLPLSGLTQEEFRQAIRQERRVEFVHESKRYFDLVRWGELIESVNSELRDRGLPFSASAGRDELLPIPQVELDRNPGLNNEQNSGYN